MLEKIALLIFCHVIGDYLFQPRFIANTKGSSWYHMFIHCVLYIVPFWFFFGFNWQLGVVFVTHVIVDAMKARWGLIGYSSDQVAHYGVLLLYIPSLCREFYGDKIFIFDIYDVWVFIGGILAGVLAKVICDIIFNRKDHKLEMEEYYEGLGTSPHTWGF